MKADALPIVVVGTGKLARELLAELPGLLHVPIHAWQDFPQDHAALVVHAGSGRELAGLIPYCQRSHSPLVELSTGTELERHHPTTFPLIVCPNTNILMLKFMNMISTSGHLFKPYPVTVTESHQASKTSTPGTAIAIAKSLGVSESAITSIRNPEVQTQALGIEANALGRHAYHRIEIGNPPARIVLETRITGDAPYAAGVAEIIAAVRSRALDNRRYQINEFIEEGWL